MLEHNRVTLEELSFVGVAAPFVGLFAFGMAFESENVGRRVFFIANVVCSMSTWTISARSLSFTVEMSIQNPLSPRIAGNCLSYIPSASCPNTRNSPLIPGMVSHFELAKNMRDNEIPDLVCMSAQGTGLSVC